MTASILNPKWLYHGSQTHADPMEFRRRMRARATAAQAAAAAANAEAATKVRQIKKAAK